MRDSDGDGKADEFITVCDDWEISGNYHEYNFGPRMDKDGKKIREDLLPFLSRIQCTKRRAHYQQLLTRVFKGELVGETRLVSGQTLSDFGSKAATVVSDTTAALAQTLLPRGSIDLQSLVGLVQCISD